MQQLFNLEGKVAIVTGSSKGIGKAAAEALGKAGASVVISSRDQAALEEVANEFRAAGIKNVLPFAANAGKEQDIDSLIQATMDTFGRIDVLVNNAAANPHFGPIETIEEKAYDKIMDINVKGPFLLAKKVLPSMQTNGGGSIINISSVEGMRPSEGLGMYSVSKAALIMMTKVMAKEWGKYNVRANTVCPGLIKTKFSEALWSNEPILKHYTKDLPLKRMGTTDEISGIILYLASDEAGYCTGSVINVDGGYLV